MRWKGCSLQDLGNQDEVGVPSNLFTRIGLVENLSLQDNASDAFSWVVALAASAAR